MKTISFINQKGGSGKTTTCLNVGACLAEKGYKVLLVDIDAQGNLTTSAGFEIELEQKTIYEVLTEDYDVNKTILHKEKYDVLPTDIRQSDADIRLATVPGRDVLLKEKLQSLNKSYDYILIDCPPSLSIITLMALTASDGVIIPIQAQYLALKGVSQLLDTIDLVKRRMNPKLEIMGAVVTMYDARKVLDRQIMEYVTSSFNDKVFSVQIGNNVALAEAPAMGNDILEYDPKCKGAEQYKLLTDEIIKRS